MKDPAILRHNTMYCKPIGAPNGKNFYQRLPLCPNLPNGGPFRTHSLEPLGFSALFAPLWLTQSKESNRRGAKGTEPKAVCYAQRSERLPLGSAKIEILGATRSGISRRTRWVGFS